MSYDLIKLYKEDSNLIWWYVNSFDKVADKTIKNYDNLIDDWGHNQIGLPFQLRDGLLFKLNYLRKNGFDVDQYFSKFNSINEKLVMLKEEKGSDLIKKLYHALLQSVKRYNAILSSGYEFEQSEIENDLDWRDSIETTIHEIESECDLNDIKERVAALDRIYMDIFKKNYSFFLEYCSGCNRDYYPPNYWWRHMTKLKQDEPDNNR